MKKSTTNHHDAPEHTHTRMHQKPPERVRTHQKPSETFSEKVFWSSEHQNPAERARTRQKPPETLSEKFSGR
jgi:hypothetical protein